MPNGVTFACLFFCKFEGKWQNFMILVETSKFQFSSFQIHKDIFRPLSSAIQFESKLKYQMLNTNPITNSEDPFLSYLKSQLNWIFRVVEIEEVKCFPSNNQADSVLTTSGRCSSLILSREKKIKKIYLNQRSRFSTCLYWAVVR